MPNISLFIPGHPGSKQSTIQGRAFGTGKKVFYTKKSSSDYQNLVKQISYQAMNGLLPAEGAVRMDIMIGYAVPASWSKNKRLLALNTTILPTVKPDRDNCMKVLQDGMNGIVFLDDKQITDGYVIKRYKEIPGIQVDIYWDK